MKTKKIILFFITIIIELAIFISTTQLLIYVLKEYFYSKNDLSWGISLFYFNIVGLFIFTISNIIIVLIRKKSIRFLSLICSILIAIFYWSDSLLIHPYRTILILITFIMVCYVGNFVTLQIWRRKNW